jgi:chromosome segregation ATPase
LFSLTSQFSIRSTHHTSFTFTIQYNRALCGWAVHSEFATDHQNELKNRTKLLKNLDKRTAELEQATKAANVTDDEETAAKNRLRELTEESNEAAQNKISLEQELKKYMAPLKTKERELQILTKEVASAKKRLQSSQFRLEKARKEILDSAGNAAEEERQRTRKIAMLEREIAEAKPRLDPLKERINEEYTGYNELSPEEQAKTKLREDAERQVSLSVF